jgi:hypothetical protein
MSMNMKTLSLALALALALAAPPVSAQSIVPTSSVIATTGCDSSVVYDAATSGATQLVGLISGKSIYVCGYSFFSAGTAKVKLTTGTGTACATGTASITPAYQLTAQAGIVDSSATYRGLKSAASGELCISSDAAVAVQAIVYYTQF